MITIKESSFLKITNRSDARVFLEDIRRRYLPSFGMPATESDVMWIEYNYVNPLDRLDEKQLRSVYLEIGFLERPLRACKLPQFYYNVKLYLQVSPPAEFVEDLYSIFKPIGGVLNGLHLETDLKYISSSVQFNQVIRSFKEFVNAYHDGKRVTTNKRRGIF